ncbi:hypothetical protein ANN_05657 [Periplaneta americana]|uniref:Uncharacterized protein n=1 Tax=Periplaneta americana TaxID=6978 RepID=A0ABQ8TDG1_PERAM|nr:hypothetical protein ANN_05657 [Periplaneta americana]
MPAHIGCCQLPEEYDSEIWLGNTSTSPPHSPDLSPCDFYIFGELKKDIRGLCFVTDEDVCDWVKNWFVDSPQASSRMGLIVLSRTVGVTLFCLDLDHAWKLPPGYSSHEVYFADASQFLEEYRWIYDFPVTELLVRGVLGQIPPDWAVAILSLNNQNLNDLPRGFVQVTTDS